MTNIDTALLAKGWGLIAEGAETISLAYSANEQPGRAASPSLRAPDPVDDLPPLEEPPTAEELLERAVAITGGEVVRQVTPDTALGRCPDHDLPWTIKPAGVSRTTGNAFDAFWKCDERDSDGYCKRKPIRAWAQSHRIPNAA